MMHLFHKWTKWEDGETKYTDSVTERSWFQPMQSRRCVKCNKLQVREVVV